jgi:hypothetical protein
MAVALIMDFEGGTTQQYDAVMADMDLRGKMPDGGRFHAAGPYENGWRVCDVWDSMEHFQAFAERAIMPLTAKHGLPEPKIEFFHVHDERRGDMSAVQFLQVVRIPDLDGTAFDALDQQVSGGGVPDHLGFHVNGRLGDGWCVVDTWDSKAARDAFLEASIRPAVEASGMDAQPTFEDMDVYNTLKADTPAPA